jgi:hypothetical protein
MSALDELLDEYGRADTAPLGTLAELRQKLDAYRAEVIAEHRATFTMHDARGIARDHRRAVLREAIESFKSWTGPDGVPIELLGMASVVERLEQLVIGGSGEKATPTSEYAPADLTIYRASHDSIVMGLYTTAAEARKHCETLVRREYGETSKVHLWWREDEDTVDQPEDGEQELYEHVKSVGVTGPGWTHRTGYVVTPLTVASKFDEEADE